MGVIDWINLFIGAVFFISSVYQLFYLAVPYLFPEKPHKPWVAHRITVLIAARNEEAVLGHLLDSIAAQSYPKELVQVCVCADNCTDGTARLAREHGALVVERRDKEKIGKGYVLNHLLKALKENGVHDRTDAYLVLDADNVLDSEYLYHINQSYCDGYEVVTGYRNSKNFGDNWISAGYGLWFLRECQFMNRPRHRLGSQSLVMGTGFLFGRHVADEMDGWNYFSMTEDTDFSMDRICHNKCIGYCENAVLYDEQPTGFRQSWRQRMRWTRGSFQMFYKYGHPLLVNFVRGCWGCYDALAANLSAFIMSLAATLVNLVNTVVRLCCGESLWPVLVSVVLSVGLCYGGLFFLGLVTALSEWHRIRTANWKKVAYLFTYPLFIFTNLPIALTGLVCRVTWKPIHHTRALSIKDLEK